MKSSKLVALNFFHRTLPQCPDLLRSDKTEFRIEERHCKTNYNFGDEYSEPWEILQLVKFAHQLITDRHYFRLLPLVQSKQFCRQGTHLSTLRYHGALYLLSTLCCPMYFNFNFFTNSWENPIIYVRMGKNPKVNFSQTQSIFRN